MKTGSWKINGRGRDPPSTEDRSFIQILSGENVIAGVFDGHSGSFTVDFVLKFLPGKLAELVRTAENNEQKIRNGLSKIFIELDKSIAQQGALYYRDSGSTATVAIITATHCYFAFIGDSPAFIFNPDTGAVITSIGKHDPTSPEEYSRIIRNSGHVTHDKGDVARVNGMLAVARAFGDFSMKFANPKVPEWDKDWAKDFCVVADPEIVVIPRPAKGVLAICSDGLVELANPMGEEFRPIPEVAKRIHAHLTGHNGDLSTVAKNVIAEQVKEFTSNPEEYDGDDIALVLIDFSKRVMIKGGGAKPAIAQATTRKARKLRGVTGKNRKQLPKTFTI